MATLFEVLQFTDNLGNPLSNGHAYWYVAGTTTPKQTWQDTAETVLNTLAYVTLDAYGRPPGGAFFIRGSYKLVVKDSTETTTYLTVDNINEYNSFDLTGLTASMADLNSTTTTAKLLGSTIPLVYTVLLADRGFTLMINALTANATINLPSAVTVGNTFKFWIKKTDKSSNKVSIIPFGTQTINGAAVAELFDYNDFVECRSDGSNWHLGSALIRGTIVNLVDDYDILLSDTGKMYNCDATAASITIQLPSCSTVGKGFTLAAKKIDASLNSVILLASGSQTIDGVSSYVLSSQWTFVNIKTDGVNWFIVNEVEPTSDWRTGDRKSSYNRFQAGWVYLDDGTIGNASSNATSRADADTQNLWVFLYDTIAEADLPMYTSGGAPVARSGVALNDYNNNYQLHLPYTQGRSEVSVGTSSSIKTFVPGEHFGLAQQVLATANLASHTHNFVAYVSPAPSAILQGGTTYNASYNTPKATESTGTSTPFSLYHPVTAVYYLIKL